MSEESLQRQDEYFEVKEKKAESRFPSKKIGKRDNETHRESSEDQKSSPKLEYISKHDGKKSSQKDAGRGENYSSLPPGFFPFSSSIPKKIHHEREIIWIRQSFTNPVNTHPFPKTSLTTEKSKRVIEYQDDAGHRAGQTEKYRKNRKDSAADPKEINDDLYWSKKGFPVQDANRSFPLTHKSAKAQTSKSPKKELIKKESVKTSSRGKSPVPGSNEYNTEIISTNSNVPKNTTVIQDTRRSMDKNADEFRERNNAGRKKAKVSFKNDRNENIYEGMRQNEIFVGLALNKRKKIVKEKQIVNVESSIEDRIKQNMRECIIQTMFILLVSIIATGMMSIDQFYFTDITEELFYRIQPNTSLAAYHRNGSRKYRVVKKAIEDEDMTFLKSDDYEDILLPKNITKRAITNTENIYRRCCPRKTLKESRTAEDFWVFAQTSMIELIYSRFWFHYTIPRYLFDLEDRKYSFENQMIGIPRLRQVRVKDDSCLIHPSVSRFFNECYSYYSLYSEETRPIREDMNSSQTSTAWVYTDYKKLNTTYYVGEISTYGGGGYYIDLTLNKSATLEMIQELEEQNWITKSTRAVFLDFTIYNANVNLFCVCKVAFEFPPSGGLIPKADFASVKLLRYLSVWDFFVLALELVFLIFVGYFTYDIYKRIKKQKIHFFAHFWNYLDLFILMLCYAFIIYSIVRYIIVDVFMHKLRNTDVQHIDFWYLRRLQIYFNYLIAVLVFFAWLRLIKFLNFTQTMMEVRATLKRSIPDIFGFALLFFIIFFAFAQVAFLTFGGQLRDYSTLWSSCMTLLQAVIGEFEYSQLEEVNQVFAPIFFISFVFFMFFILMNMFLAIINDSYAVIKSEVDLEHVKREQYLHIAYLNIRRYLLCGLDKKFRKENSRLKTYAEIKELLLRSGFTDVEIEVFFRKYNIELNQVMNVTENKRILNDLELKGLDFHLTEEQVQFDELKRKVERLNDRVADIQRNLQPVINKIDLILSRLSL